MRTILYTLLLAVIITSCRSIEKMVESGQYEEAYAFAIQKLAGDKKKKTKYVQGLEKAYALMQEEDLRRIEALKLNGSDTRWTEIYHIYTALERRQNMIRPLLPLISADGYRARINIQDYAGVKYDSQKSAVAYHLSIADQYMIRAEGGDKYSARMAYRELEEVVALNFRDDNVRNTMARALELGTLFVGIDIQNDGNNSFSDAFRNRLNQINTAALNNKWTRFYIVNPYGEEEFDRYIVLDPGRVDFGPEREYVENSEFVKSIQDGEKIIRDKNGHIVKDSLGEPITVPHMIDVKAFVTQVFREKLSRMDGKLMVFNNPDGYPIQSIPIGVVHEFRSSAYRFQGDKRALPSSVSTKLSGILAGFPSDYDAAMILADRFTSQVASMIYSLDLSVRSSV